LLAEINAEDESVTPFFGKYSREKANSLKAYSFERVALGNRGMKYERLDRLTFDLLMGVR
jgi:xylose isomerase